MPILLNVSFSHITYLQALDAVVALSLQLAKTRVVDRPLSKQLTILASFL